MFPGLCETIHLHAWFVCNMSKFAKVLCHRITKITTLNFAIWERFLLQNIHYYQSKKFHAAKLFSFPVIIYNKIVWERLVHKGWQSCYLLWKDMSDVIYFSLACSPGYRHISEGVRDNHLTLSLTLEDWNPVKDQRLLFLHLLLAFLWKLEDLQVFAQNSRVFLSKQITPLLQRFWQVCQQIGHFG